MPNSPNTDNYTEGKGVVSVAAWSGGAPGSYIDVGNAPSFAFEPAVEKRPHYSSRQGPRLKDKNPVIQVDYTVTFDLDEISAQNINRFVMGTISGNNLIKGLQNTDQEYSVKLVTNNPTGPNYTYEFHRVTLTPNGALQLIGDEWMAMSYSAEGLADTVNNPTSPYFTITGTTTTTTTTTTS